MATDIDAREMGRVGLVLASLFLFVPAVRAQQTERVLPSPERLLREAYARTKAAPREQDLTEIIRMCRQARRSETSETVAGYADELAAWAHNRRGELQAAEAVELTGQNRLAEAAERDARALGDFQAAIALDPKNWKPLHNRGVSRALAGQWDEALEDFDRVLALNPTHANAWFNRGEIRAERGEYERAVTEYSEALERTPDDAEAYRRRAQAYVQLRKLKDALGDLDRAVQLAPRNTEVLLDRGDVHRSLGQWQLAAEDYRQAVAMDPRNGRAYQSAAWLLATCPLDRYRNAELAVQAAEKALDLDGRRNVRYLDTAAAAYANAGQFEKACEILALAIDMAKATDNAAAQAELLRRRLEIYQRQQPYREPQPTGTAASGS